MPPMHRRRHLGRRVPPMMRRRAAMAMMVVTVVVGGGLCGRTPHNRRGHSPRAMPGKNRHAAGVGCSRGHAPQNEAKWQDVQTTQHRCQPDWGEKVAPRGTPPDQKNREGEDLKNQRQNKRRVNRGLTPHSCSSGERRVHQKNQSQVAIINVEQDEEQGRG
jgi:hypothetical protein